MERFTHSDSDNVSAYGRGMALPKWLWNPGLFRDGWAWGRLKHRQRKEALKLADAGERHPDPEVADKAASFARSALAESTFSVTVQIAVLAAILVAAWFAARMWGWPTAGGIGAGIAGIGAAVWRRVHASRLTKAYSIRSPDDPAG